MANTGAVAALQAALAAENAAIFGYGVAGAHLTGSSQATAEQDWTGHNQARDTLAAMISARGAVPAAAQAYYRLPFWVHDAASAIRLAGLLGGERYDRVDRRVGVGDPGQHGGEQFGGGEFPGPDQPGELNGRSRAQIRPSGRFLGVQLVLRQQ